MTPAERDDLNKRIAEDLGWHRISFVWHSPECRFESGIACSSLGCGPLPSFTTDPALTLLLMEKILGTGRDLTINVSGENLVNLSSDYIELKDVIRIQFKPIGEAVAMAYLAMRGLK